MERTNQRLLVVSNRLPVVITEKDNTWSVEPAAGGLVTALAPLMRKNRGLWLGWPGCDPDAPTDHLLAQAASEQGFELKGVPVNEQEIAGYYRGFSNGTLWPLFHDLLGHCRFEESDWQTYVEINRRFANVLSQHVDDRSFVWIHDYQLLLVGYFLRQLGIKQYLNFFLHIPFPSRDLFKRLPWRQEILESILHFDHIGFQTSGDMRNFVQCVKTLVKNAKVKGYRRQTVVELEGREVKLGFYPISIDFEEFNTQAQSKEVADAAWFAHEKLPSRTLVLGLDRLDYTKGVPERFLAFERMLEKYPEALGNVSLVQVIVPSRVKVPEYQSLKDQLDQLVGRINSRFTQHGWIPIHYMFRHLDRTELLAYYRTCEIALVTPLRDGMNLVSKEYCAANVDCSGTLILSEFAGAAPQMSKGALMVNPYDIEGTADAIFQAYIMSAEQKSRRMRSLRSEVKRNDVHKWVEWFLGSQVSEAIPDTVPTFQDRADGL